MKNLDLKVLSVVLVFILFGVIFLVPPNSRKSTLQKDIEFTTKIFECMYYCRENYGLEGCKNACFYVRENAKGGE